MEACPEPLLQALEVRPMSRAVIYEKFGGPEVLELQDVPEPHAGPGEVRVRVAAVGLNPMDWAIAASPELAARFNITLPSGFGYDFAGVVDEVGDRASGLAVGERVYGGVMERAAADFVVVKTAPGASEALFHTPESLSDEVASTLSIAGGTASAALAAIDLGPQDTILIGGAAGGVGVFAVQLARLVGATVIGTASADTFPFLRELGAEPVTYGAGLADGVRALAPDGVSAAVDLFGTETVETALALGVAPERIAAIAAGPTPPGGARAVWGADADPGALPRIAAAIVAGQITVPIAARFPIEQIREATALQSDRHVHGKIVVTL
jgi:NADPH:quinone reductase-like Zn-dependent oxidoreductase